MVHGFLNRIYTVFCAELHVYQGTRMFLQMCPLNLSLHSLSVSEIIAAVNLHKSLLDVTNLCLELL